MSTSRTTAHCFKPGPHSFRPKDDPPDAQEPGHRNAQPDFKGQKRSNDTHASTSDPDARLYRKSHNSGAQLSCMGHMLMEHRSGLVRRARVSLACGHGKREKALAMLSALSGCRRRTVAADKAYDTADVVTACRTLGVTFHGGPSTAARYVMPAMP